jgi:hypothetical protein
MVVQLLLTTCPPRQNALRICFNPENMNLLEWVPSRVFRFKGHAGSGCSLSSASRSSLLSASLSGSSVSSSASAVSFGVCQPSRYDNRDFPAECRKPMAFLEYRDATELEVN